jgi:ADP-heptose:LPS heptosyltransferase
METKKPFAKLFGLSSRLTDKFPRAGAWFLDRTVTAAFGNRYFRRVVFRRDVERLRYIREFSSILLIGDLNIGDAVNIQAAVTALRDFFPDAEIDYVLNRFARRLVQGNPEITNLWPIFTGAYFPDEGDFPRIEEIVALHRYNLILNFCPLFHAGRLTQEEGKVISYTGLAARLLRNEHTGDEANHIVNQTYRFVRGLFSEFLEPKRAERFTGVRVTLADGAVQKAIAFMKEAGLLYANFPVIIFNPNTTSPFTQVPAAKQGELLGRLALDGARILLSAGQAEERIEGKLLGMLPENLRQRITVIPPSLPLDAYAALVDFADVHISGDTGPLHIAAARKYSASGHYRFRNRTAVVSLFGATPARIYGYASHRPGYFAANQDAPSFAYSSGSPCRNITCINKMAKTCAQPRCFLTLDTGAVVNDIRACLALRRRRFPNRAVADPAPLADRKPACSLREEQ